MKIQNGLLNKVLNRRELELETFDLLDVFSDNYEEVVEEYKAKACSLELDVSKGIIPFPELSRAEVNTWEVYCPQKTKLNEYNKVIPIEVIRLAEIVKNKNFFHHLEIWEESKEQVDPIMVGVLDDSWNSPKYLLARWGLSLLPYEQIRDMAKKIWKESRKAKLEQEIRSNTRKLEDIENDCVKHFDGETVWS